MSSKSTILFEEVMKNVVDNLHKLEEKIGDLSYFIYMLDVDEDTKAKLDDMITDVFVQIDRLK